MDDQIIDANMKLNLMLGCAVVAGMVMIGSCSDDDPPPKTGINFELESFSVLESFDGDIESFHPDLITGGIGRDVEVKILLDRPLAETAILQYSVSGTASKTNPPGSAVNDFVIKDGINTIVGSDKITIEEGATEATIKITVFEDFSFEVDDDDNPIETLIIELKSVSSGSAILGEKTTYTLNIEEDDALILLAWLVDGTESYGDVDMDMFVWYDDLLVTRSTWDNNDPEAPDPPYEGLYIPAGFDNGNYDLSYTYYSGTSDEVDFVSFMWGRFNNKIYPYYSFEGDDYIASEGTYTKANINKWDDEVEGIFPTLIAQTIVKNGVGYTSVSEIIINEAGSRIRTFADKAKFDRKTKTKFNKLKMVDIPKNILMR